MTPFGSQHADSTPRGQIGGLILPSSSSGPVGEFRIEGHGGNSSVLGGPVRSRGEIIAEPLLEPDFGFDADGNMIDLAPGQSIAGTPTPGSAMYSNAAASAQMRQEHEAGQRAGIQVSPSASFHLRSHLYPVSPSSLLRPFMTTLLPSLSKHSSPAITVRRPNGNRPTFSR